jgi:hypothetical protein
VEPERHVAGQAGRIGRQLLGATTDEPVSGGERDERLLELDRAGVEGPRELALLAHDRAEDLVAPFVEMRVGVAHRLDHDLRRLGHERLAAAEKTAVPDGASQDPTEDVAATLVRRQHAVPDEERHGPAVVGDDLVAEALLLERLGVVADELAHPGVDGGKQIGVVVRSNALDDRGDALKAHARVHARERQRHAAVRTLVELHEDEVPHLEPARAVLGVIGDAVRALRELRASVVVDLAARATGTCLGHPPEVLVVALVDVAPLRHPLGRKADLLAPDVPGELVVGVRGRRKALSRDPEIDGQELPGPVDRLALEVIAEAPVAEHLEQRVVARRAADLLEVVVLAGDPEAALVVHGAVVAALLGPGEHVLELDHAGVREEERRVRRRDEARARHGRVASTNEEVDEPSPDLRG